MSRRLDAVAAHLRPTAAASSSSAVPGTETQGSADARGADAMNVVIIGGGPSGLAAAASFVAGGIRCTVVDAGGMRVGRLSRFGAAGVPANTKVTNILSHFHGYDEIFAAASPAAAVAALRKSGVSFPGLEPFDPAEPLGWTGLDSIVSVYEAITEELRASGLVEFVHGEVAGLELESATGEWTAWGERKRVGTTAAGNQNFKASGRALVLATGAEPRTLPQPGSAERNSSWGVHGLRTRKDRTAPEVVAVTAVGSELALDCAQLREKLQQEETKQRVVVAVVGNSHTGVLVLENLHLLATEGLVDEVRVLTRGGDGCRIAEWDRTEYRWTNTGLKGRAAAFARRFLPLENEEQRGDVIREPWPQGAVFD